MSKIYEIFNPSDCYTMESENFLAAAVAVILLGEGKYGIEGTPCLFGWGAWLKENIPDGLDRYIQENREVIALALDSVMIGGEAERKSYKKGLELITDETKRNEWRAHWQNERRTSLNDMGARAWALAARIRGDANQEVPADRAIIGVL